ncbi:MAG: alanine:cation symporter family protein [Deltaproteobacteria bacterium]|nr:alanine:cation symporter family protein [Deltaproteobacteria bacterium]
MIDDAIDAAFRPLAKALSDAVFLAVPIGDAEVPLIVAWLVAGALFFTVYLRFINLRGMGHAIRIVRGDFSDARAPGELTPFQALTTAISGTVGVGNIAHVAIAISVGGPGALFWLVVAGFLGMSTKFAECMLAVRYREIDADGVVSGGPMYTLRKGLAEIGWPRLGRGLAAYYAFCIVVGALGIGCMFQSNQAYVQLVGVTGGEASFFATRGWLFGLVLAGLVGVVIVGGIRTIAEVTQRLVPFMALLYAAMAIVVIGANAEKLPWAVMAIVRGAFSSEGMTGGVIAIIVLGFRRAAFSNEAGIGSAAIAHSAVQTDEPVSEGFVALLEPFIDTIIICSLTALVITVTVYDPANPPSGMSGVELTSAAMESVVSWFPLPLAVIVALFAYSTMISWSYYGLEGWIYLFGGSWGMRRSYHAIFCAFVVVGCTTKLDAVLDFSDALIFAMALANVFGLYALSPIVKRELDAYWSRHGLDA